QMWLLRTKYAAPLRVNPMTLEKHFVRSKPTSSWKAINEDAALALVNDALRWITEFGPFVASFQDEIWEQSKKFVGLTRTKRGNARTNLYKKLENEDDVARLRLALAMPLKSTYLL